jgi:hypothetical protein
MNWHSVALAVVVAVTSLTSPDSLAAQQELPAQPVHAGSDAQESWIQIHPGDETGCAFDTPYSFFLHRGPAPTKLLVYFQGGGACWEWVSCSGMFDSSVERDELSEYRGIFDFENPENPFRDFTVVFVPYCTGDVHVGDATQRYGDDPQARPVHHRGYQNVSAVLTWIREQRFDPAQVVVAGASAGAYGALFYTRLLAETYPSAMLVLIGDSGVPLLKDYPSILERWGAAPVLRQLWRSSAPLDVQDLTLERAHEAAADSTPAILTQITSDRDAIQSAFYLISGSPRWREATYELLDTLEVMLPSFRSFVVAGPDHGLLRTDAFYSYEADGVRLRDWIQDLLGRTGVNSRRCRQCRTN